MMFSDLKTDLALLKALRENAEAVKKMTPEELEQMLKAQRESWCRQDMD
jgi:alkylhydroperoxidase/carboxymuconolactone decarboxylase family protein YurZ